MTLVDKALSRGQSRQQPVRMGERWKKTCLGSIALPVKLPKSNTNYHFCPCNQCHQEAKAVDRAERVAIDLHLDHPILLHITVSIHYCAKCDHYFRAQLPFLRPDAIYTNRVVLKTVQSVIEDGMAKRRVTDRMAREFWVKPSETSVRNWCKTYQSKYHFETDYQPWIIRSFSGVLCVDEVFSGGSRPASGSRSRWSAWRSTDRIPINSRKRGYGQDGNVFDTFTRKGNLSGGSDY